MNRRLRRWSGALAYALAFAAPVDAQVLTLDEALKLGEAQSPRLAAQRSAVAASSEQVGRAAELPDPRLRLGIENLPVNGADQFRYDRDSMTMRTVGVMQEFPNSAKRSARSLRAERMRDAASAQLAARRAELLRDIAAAWLDVHFAECGRALLGRLVSQFQLQVDMLAPAIATGKRSAADGLAARGAMEQARDRALEQESAAAKARYMLAAFVGEDAKRPLAEAPDMRRFAHSREHLVARIADHPELRMQQELERLARAEVELARSTAKPDWALEVGYGYRRPAFDNMLTVMVSIDLPWQKEHRQDRDIASRLAELDQVRALRENARRMHEAEVRGWLADFDTAAQRVERFTSTLLPLARERAGVARAAYQGGRGDLQQVLDAERAVTETELALNEVLGERAKAWARLNYLYPEDVAR